jgi:hypothetical protein
MTDLSALIDEITTRNVACVRVDKLMYDVTFETLVMLGATDCGYATWGVSIHDRSSFWGHYFTVSPVLERECGGKSEAWELCYDEALADFADRTGLLRVRC